MSSFKGSFKGSPEKAAMRDLADRKSGKSLIKKSGTYKGKSNKLGGGGRFQQLTQKAGGGKKGAAIAASIGRAKYGNAKMASMAAKGKMMGMMGKK